MILLGKENNSTTSNDVSGNPIGNNNCNGKSSVSSHNGGKDLNNVEKGGKGAEQDNTSGFDMTNCCRNLVARSFTKKQLNRKLPITDWLPKYTLEYFVSDLIAGITVGLTVIPQGIAYALVAELPPQVSIKFIEL